MPEPISLETVQDMLARLVAIPSVTPKDRTPKGSPFGEERMVAFLDERCTSWGAQTERRLVAPGRENFLARFEGADPSRSLMLEAHSDTVQVQGMSVPPFEPKIENGRLYGRGSCDTKGSMAAMLVAIRRVLDESGRLPRTVYLVSTCGEELGCIGAHALMRDNFRTDAAVVGEPTELKVVHAHRGAMRFRLSTKGVSAHSSVPARGINAIYLMRHAIEAIETRLAPSLSAKHHPVLGSPIMSIGTIRGGTQVNMVPARCEIMIDWRMIPTETLDEVTSSIENEMKRLAETVPNFIWQLKEYSYYPPFEEDPESPLTRFVVDACRTVLGSAERDVGPYAANSGVFKRSGIPCVLFGPGSIAQAHTASEYVELEQVVKAAEVYAQIIRSFPKYATAQ